MRNDGDRWRNLDIWQDSDELAIVFTALLRNSPKKKSMGSPLSYGGQGYRSRRTL
jgi:hypothetical protein